MKAIRRYCVETCCADDQEYVRECPGSSLNIGVFCPLHPYRMGIDPTPSRKGPNILPNREGGKFIEKSPARDGGGIK